MKSNFQIRSIGSDNHSGIHPEILKAIVDINSNHTPSYGTDPYTMETVENLKTVFGNSCDIHFVFNGTAANVLALKSLLKSHEAVICANTAHLHMDECGAPESAIGCKVLTAETPDGKLTPELIETFLIRGGDQHYAQPKLVSITQPTEYGTVYSIEELKKLRAFTSKHNLYLHIDGARLIYAAHVLNANLKNITEDIGVDIVSFGGTKNGLLFGEMVIIYNPLAKKDFKYIRKQGMQLPSKMRFLSTQFNALLLGTSEVAKSEIPLWKQITTHGHNMALYLAKQLETVPRVKITQKIQANSVFALIPKEWLKPLREVLFFYVWDELSYKKEGMYEVRWMFSFDSTKEDVDQFIAILKTL
jgi:threonine aldolase